MVNHQMQIVFRLKLVLRSSSYPKSKVTQWPTPGVKPFWKTSNYKFVYRIGCGHAIPQGSWVVSDKY